MTGKKSRGRKQNRKRSREKESERGKRVYTRITKEDLERKKYIYEKGENERKGVGSSTKSLPIVV